MPVLYQIRYGFDYNATKAMIKKCATAPSEIFLQESNAREAVKECGLRWYEEVIWKVKDPFDCKIIWTNGVDDLNYDYTEPYLTAIIKGISDQRWSATVFRGYAIDDPADPQGHS